MTRVLVIDDHPMVLQRCLRLFEEAGATEIHQARTLAEGLRLYRRHKPEMIVADLAMRTGALGGLSLIQHLRIRDDATPILVFAMHNDPVIVSRALEMGATGYVLRNAPSDEIVRAFNKVRAGGRYLSRDLAADVAFMEARGKSNPLRAMTLRELQTLALIAEGRPYGAIAEELNVSYKTVANTCAQLKSKLGVRRLSELTRAALHYLPQAGARAAG